MQTFRKKQRKSLNDKRKYRSKSIPLYVAILILLWLETLDGYETGDDVI
jgi:hypothetical protein